MTKLTKTQIVARLKKWGKETFEGAYKIYVEKGEFGGWDVHVEWDEDQWFEEIHSFEVRGDKFRSTGVMEIHA